MLKLSGLFGDHAVLQRDRVIPVWGWSDPLELIEGTLGDIRAATRAGKDGRFLLRFPPMAAGGPFRLEVATRGSRERASASDILIGEVWLASGQSNMEFSIAALPEHLAAIRQEASAPQMRLFKVPRSVQLSPIADVKAPWLVASAETVELWSAVSYFFARKLHEKLGVPVGVVVASWGGTIAEAWTSRQTLVRNPDFAANVAAYERQVASPEFWSRLTEAELAADGEEDLLALETACFARMLAPVTENRGEKAGWAEPGFDDCGWKPVELPSMWRLLDANFNGVLWFRREVRIPAEWAGRDLMLAVGSVDKHDITYFNGVEVGRTGKDFETCHWDRQRVYRVPGELVRSGRGVIAVRDYSFIYDGGLNGPAERMRLYPADDEASAIGIAGLWRMGVELDQGLVAAPNAAMGPGNPNSYNILFDNMIRPLIPMAMRGAIWYQGESNESAPGYYRRLMADLIRDWRMHWEQGEFPFLQVLLAGFRTPCTFDHLSNWALIREAQIQAARDTGNPVVSAVDLGDAGDIHPHRKQEVGERLAAAALERTYGAPYVGTGPEFREMVREEHALRLFFDRVGTGLTAPQGGPGGFVIADTSRKFFPATAEIIGDSVRVSAPGVDNPIAVRYGWADHPVTANLGNREGFPAVPFRTDTFPRN